MKKFTFVFRFIGIFLFIYFVYNADYSRILNHIDKLEWKDIFLFIFLIFFSQIVRSLRSYLMFNNLNNTSYNYSFKENFLIYLTGLFFGAVTPSRVGEIVKVRYLKKIGKPEALFVTVGDRIWDAFYVVFFAWLSFLFLEMYALFIWSTVIAVLTCVIIYGFFKNKVIQYLQKYNLKKFLDYSPAQYFKIIWITLASNLIYFYLYFSIFRAIGVDLPISTIFWIHNFSMIIIVMPISIMGFGAREAVYIGFLNQHGYSNEYSISIGVVVMAFYLLVIFVSFLSWAYLEHFIKRRPEFYEI
ncbi:MAG: lysylphosphatidylglycerol synthase transmembrane domain-containing protein [Candidatus Muiribacteriota bacterium]